MDVLYTARGESFLVPAKAGAHDRQAQLFHQVSMSVVDVELLTRTMDLLYTARVESFLVPAKAGAHARQAQLFHQVSMSVVDVNHLNRTMDSLYTARVESFLIPAEEDHMQGWRCCTTTTVHWISTGTRGSVPVHVSIQYPGPRS